MAKHMDLMQLSSETLYISYGCAKKSQRAGRDLEQSKFVDGINIVSFVCELRAWSRLSRTIC